MKKLSFSLIVTVMLVVMTSLGFAESSLDVATPQNETKQSGQTNKQDQASKQSMPENAALSKRNKAMLEQAAAAAKRRDEITKEKTTNSAQP